MNAPPRHSVPVARTVFSVCWLIFVMVAFSGAAFVVPFLIALIVGVLWFLHWLNRLTTWWGAKHRDPSLDIAPKMRRLIFWGIEPVAMIFSILLVATSIPQTVRILLSSNELRAYVEDVRAGNIVAGPSAPRRVGLFTIMKTDLLTNGTVRIVTGGDLLDSVGFVFSETPPPAVGETDYTHLIGPWWHWYESW